MLHGTLPASTTVNINLHATNAVFTCNNLAILGCDVYLSFNPTAGRGSAWVAESPPSHNSTDANYGATDTLGFQPPTGF